MTEARIEILQCVGNPAEAYFEFPRREELQKLPVVHNRSDRERR